MIYFLKSTLGFYNDDVHNVIPNEAIQISNDKYEEIMVGQSNGLSISADADGNPILIESAPTIKTYAELRKAEYPPIEDYLDAIVKDDSEQLQKYIKDCLAVKAKYPKL